MSNDDKIIELFNLVQTSFNNAMKQADVSKQYAQWKSCSQFASVAACRIASEGDLFRAAALEGVKSEARRQMFEITQAEGVAA